PTFTTTRRAPGMCSRPCRGGRVIGSVIGARARTRIGVTGVVSSVGPEARLTLTLQLRPCGGLRFHPRKIVFAALLTRLTPRAIQARVSPARAHDEFRRRRQRGLPVEHDTTVIAD